MTKLEKATVASALAILVGLATYFVWLNYKLDQIQTHLDSILLQTDLEEAMEPIENRLNSLQREGEKIRRDAKILRKRFQHIRRGVETLRQKRQLPDLQETNRPRKATKLDRNSRRVLELLRKDYP